MSYRLWTIVCMGLIFGLTRADEAVGNLAKAAAWACVPADPKIMQISLVPALKSDSEPGQRLVIHGDQMKGPLFWMAAKLTLPSPQAAKAMTFFARSNDERDCVMKLFDAGGNVGYFIFHAKSSWTQPYFKLSSPNWMEKNGTMLDTAKLTEIDFVFKSQDIKSDLDLEFAQFFLR